MPKIKNFLTVLTFTALVATTMGTTSPTASAPHPQRRGTVVHLAAQPVAAVTIPTGYPTAATTGVPAGTPLRASGPLTITVDGTIIDGLDINGCVTVSANYVRIVRTRIRCARGTTPAVRVTDGYVGLAMQDSEIDGLGQTQAAVGYSEYLLLRVNVHNVWDGVRVGTHTTVISSYIHDLKRWPSEHSDTVQTTGGSSILVFGNTLLPYNATTNDPMNSAFMVGTELSPVLANVRFENNFVDGGNYTVNVRTDVVNVSNVWFRNNKFGRDYRYGAYIGPSNPQIHFEPTNVYLNGSPV